MDSLNIPLLPLLTEDKYPLLPLGRKIFLDRYAKKDGKKTTMMVGDIVVVCVDKKTGQREIGKIQAILREGKPATRPDIEVIFDDGLVQTFPLEHVDKPLETHPSQMMKRIVERLITVESEDQREYWIKEFSWLLENWKFAPGGRILAGTGVDEQLSLYNCYVIPRPSDSRGGILRTLGEMMEIMSRGGGVGMNLSSLRPRHGYVKGVNGRSSGAVSWGALYSFVTGLVEQGGSRRGAGMLVLEAWHPDVEEFIDAKKTAGRITNANISVGVSDVFMDAVKYDADWDLVFPDTSDTDYDELWNGELEDWKALGKKVIVHKTMKARDLWHQIIESAWASAEPGLWFKDRANKYSNSWYFSPLIGTNPCGEQSLPGYGVCNLGSLYVARFLKLDESGKVTVDWSDLKRATKAAIRFLDDICDLNKYFLDANEKQQLSERRVGLGTFGLGELLIRLGMRYGSKESIEFIDEFYGFIACNAYEASVEIAKEKGAFPQFDAEKFLQSGFMLGMPEYIREQVRQHGIRNVTLITQPPVGSVGTMIGTSTGIEPFFDWEWERKSRLGSHIERVAVYDEWKKANPGKILPDYFVTAMTLTPEEHIAVLGAIQRWTDSSVSKTANLPENYTIEQTKALYEKMYELGCKGGTVYRDKSRDVQVLNRIEKTDEDQLLNQSKVNANAQNTVKFVDPERGVVEEQIEKMLSSEWVWGRDLPPSEQKESAKQDDSNAQSQVIDSLAAMNKGQHAILKTYEKLLDEYKVLLGKCTCSAKGQTVEMKTRPYKRSGVTCSKQTALGTAHVTMNYDEAGEPLEVFVEIGKAGSDVKAMAEAIGRLISLILQLPSGFSQLRKIEEIISQIKGIGGAEPFGWGKNKNLSLPDAIGKILEEEFINSSVESSIDLSVPILEHKNELLNEATCTQEAKDDDVNEKEKKRGTVVDLCPSCGQASLHHVASCTSCRSCGFSKC